MSRWRSVWLVAKREILERGRSRGFIFSVAFTTLLVVGSFVVPTLLFGDEDTKSIGIVQPAPAGLDAALTATAARVDQKIELVRYDDYWKGPAALDSIVFRPIVEEQTRVTELQAGNIDFAYDLPPDNVAQLRESPDINFFETPLGHVWFLVMNTKAGPTADVKVRQAVAHAINSELIISEIL